MDIVAAAAATEERAGVFAGAWGWLKGLPEKLKNKAVEVAKSAKKLGQDDPRRVTHSLKAGLALTLASSIYYLSPPFNYFGVFGMWALLTVVVVFEFTVGATLLKCFNTSFGTLCGCALGIGANSLAYLFGDKGPPIVEIILILLFFLGAVSSFIRFNPRIVKSYDYGVLIFISTFTLVAVSGYRTDDILQLADKRLFTILIGVATCLVISIFVFPVWAGQDLHKLTVSNLEKLANYLQGLGGQYFNEGNVTTGDMAALVQGYESVLDSKSDEDSWANFARWEPAHGGFHFRHPWKQYPKIGDLARQCAYHIKALDDYINSDDIQAPLEFRNIIRESSTKMSSESSKALKELALAIETMTDPSAANPHVENSKTAINDLEILALQAATTENREDVLAIIPIVSLATKLKEITKCVEKISESVHELSRLAHFNSVEPTISPERPQLLHSGSIVPVSDGDSTDHVAVTVHV
ncbi:aluminum-activated malate transporter 8-like [Alnus glutinosa]|uniref:aluminum-activated malate transporter 8-like n=1 Tax=Alnus glutinosa TaxID=3517 RepID=UPI002D76B6AA|nr:aluminum-activated malate transporter 8-like [Alnus glutinosa]